MGNFFKTCALFLLACCMGYTGQAQENSYSQSVKPLFQSTDARIHPGESLVPAICHSSTHSADTTLGLSPFGREVVREMNLSGILVDVSHCSSGTFWDCINYSKAPIICSHSGAKAVFPHDRNLTDDQLRALSRKDGIVMVYIVPDYMRADKKDATLDDMMEHLMHCIRVAGIDHVGISCDFDGGGGGWGLNGDNDAINVTVRLMEAGYTDEEIGKIWSGNFFRVLKAAQDYAGRL